MISELLPIGSVVMLKGGNKKLMIFGVKQSEEGDTKVEYDYIGVFYPEGNIGLQYQFFFNHKDIESVCFRGFEDESRVEFIKKLSSLYNE